MPLPPILLIDDDEIEAEAISRGFRHGHLANPLIYACDGVSGLAILHGSPNVPPLHKPYIILVDMNMPRMNGLEFLQALRQDPDLTDTVVFMLTTSDGFGDRLAAYKAHIAGYILKQNVDPDFVNVIQLLTDYQTLIALPA